FRTARWNLLLVAAQSQAPDSQAAPQRVDGEIPCSLRSFYPLGRTVRSMKTEPQRTCPSCGNEFSGAVEFCPVCMLRKGLAGGVASGKSSFQQAIRPISDQPPKRFEHYELVTGEVGNRWSWVAERWG